MTEDRADLSLRPADARTGLEKSQSALHVIPRGSRKNRLAVGAVRSPLGAVTTEVTWQLSGVLGFRRFLRAFFRFVFGNCSGRGNFISFVGA